MNQCLYFHISKMLAWIHMLWRATCLLHMCTRQDCWSWPAHLKACLLLHFHFPIFDSWRWWGYLDKTWLCSWIFLQGFRCNECYWLWITPTEFSLIYSGGLPVCILRKDLCNLSDLLQRSSRGICLLSIVSWGIEWYFYAVSLHTYLCTECLYWYMTHS